MIHKKIKQLRIDKNLTQSEASKGLNMSQNAYSLMETGKTKIDHQRIIELAAFYKISPLELLNEEILIALQNKIDSIKEDDAANKMLADNLELAKYLKEVIQSFDRQASNFIKEQKKFMKESKKHAKSINSIY